MAQVYENGPAREQAWQGASAGFLPRACGAPNLSRPSERTHTSGALLRQPGGP